MRLVFSGGGTGGHFYPIIAVAEQINALAKEKNKEVELYYLAPSPFDPELLDKNNIKFKKITAGKIRKYSSGKNLFDVFKTFFGVISSVFKLFVIYPDVVFGKGGYASFPVLFAARILFIPVIIHESDTIPGKTNKWASKFAKRIAISFPEAVKHLPKEKTAHTGNPIRSELFNPLKEGAFEEFSLEKDLPTIAVLGGSQGAQNINNTVIKALPEILKNYQVIHQTGEVNHQEVLEVSNSLINQHPNKKRYHPVAFLTTKQVRMMAGVSDLIISRAGSSIFEIATWRIPSIIIPISESISHEQVSNAYSYARVGACIVIEEENLSSNLLTFEINELFKNPEKLKKMKLTTKDMVKPEAAETIAKEIFKIASKHQ